MLLSCFFKQSFAGDIFGISIFGNVWQQLIGLHKYSSVSAAVFGRRTAPPNGRQSCQISDIELSKHHAYALIFMVYFVCFVLFLFYRCWTTGAGPTHLHRVGRM